MDLHAISDALWLYLAAPVVGLVALVLTWRLGLPQITRLAQGFAALRAEDSAAAGSLSPLGAVSLSTAASFAMAGAVGTATAVALGGAGAIAWTWLFALLLAPWRMAETVLARTAPPGSAKDGKKRVESPPGSLVGRLLVDGGFRPIALVLFVLLALAALFTVGGVHGVQTVEAARGVLPDGATPLALGVAALAAVLGVAGPKRAGMIVGWIALVAIVAILFVFLAAALTDPGRALSAFARSVGEAFQGAPETSPWAGALAGEIARQAVTHQLTPAAASGSTEAVLHAAVRARTTRGQASAALLGPLAHALLTTVLGVAFVATGAYYRPVDDARPLNETHAYKLGFDTTSQRLEVERLHSGFTRVVAGEMRDVTLKMATDRAVITHPTFTYYGRTADLAIRWRDGHPDRLMRLQGGVLTDIPLTQARYVEVHGEMPPSGAALLSAAALRGPGGASMAQLVLAALLLLVIVGAGAWGVGLAKSAEGVVPARFAPLFGLLPGAGIALAAWGRLGWLADAGSIAAAVLVVVTGLVLGIKSGEAAKLLR